MSTSTATLEDFRGPVRADAVVVYPLIVVGGMVLWWADRYRAASLPLWAPWEFEWSWYLSATLSLFWYLRGLSMTPKHERPALWRPACFLIGLGLIYAVLQTHFEYMAQHMFFLNRAQHVVMHHLGPFLMVLAWPGATLMRGMPAPVRRATGWKPLVATFRVLQQPVLAATLFAGLVAFWLVPSIHFKAMIDPTLYTIMNWTMVGDGILFWCLVLDPRPSPPAPCSHATRMVASMVVMFPQIVIGAMIAFANWDIYAFYDWCGRLYPSIGAIDDQTYGGLIAWIPAAMMSIAGLLWAINMLRINEEKHAEEFNDDENDGEGVVISSAGWTGS